MARTESVLSIFLASPSDVAEERNRLEEALMDWNRTWARNLGVRLELLRWEYDAYPSIGEDAQDVINGQIPQNYDLFVGLMWSIFGTPTGRAGSGTVEEFERALARAKASLEEVSILFYFKDAPMAPSKVDPTQLKNLQNFKTSLEHEGVLYWEFSEVEQFEKLVLMHITKHVQNWRQRHQSPPKISQTQFVVTEPEVDLATPESACVAQEEDGYLDLLEVFEDRSVEVSEVVNRLADAQAELSKRLVKGTEDLQALQRPPNAATQTQIKRLIAKVAEEMDRFTNRVNAEMPLLRSAMNGSINALTRAAMLSVDFDPEQTHAAKTAATSLLSALRGAKQSMSEFKSTTNALPRITKDLNTAKRRQSTAMDSLIAEFESGEQLLVEALTVLDTLLQEPQL